MSTEKARLHLKKFDLEDRIKLFEEETKTVEQAANVLKCEKGQIGKTMSFKLKDKYILIVTSGDTKIDNNKFKEEFCEKPSMIKKEEVEEIIGHDIGGVCPFGIKDNIEVYLDESIKRYNNIYPAAGNEKSMVNLTIKELEDSSEYKKYIDVSVLIN